MGGPATTKVLYITAWGRSGTTILNRILGSAPGVFAAGELHTIWRVASQPSLRCGCKLPLTECSIWRPVIETLARELDFAHLDLLHSRILDSSVSSLIHPTSNELVARIDEYAGAISKLYAVLQEVTGAAAIVDSSKQPANGAILERTHGLALRYLHLVRDPRAVAFSWERRKVRSLDTKEEMARFSPARSTLNWVRWNRAAEQLLSTIPNERWMRLTYEGFAAEPRAMTLEILNLIDPLIREPEFVDDHSVRIETTHSVEGNPNRFETGVIKIKPDDAWIASQSMQSRFVSTLVSLPRLRRYRYPLIAKR